MTKNNNYTKNCVLHASNGKRTYVKITTMKAANKINNGDRLLQQVLRCLEHEVCLPQSLAPVSENAKRTKLYNLIIPRTQN